MSASTVSSGSRVLSRIACIGLAASLLAGCSSDALRFGDAFNNPFSTTDSTATGSTAKSAAAKAAAAKVAAQKAAAPTPSPVAKPAPEASAPQAPFLTGSISKTAKPAAQPAAQPNLASAAGWGAEGGTPIVAAQGESADMLSTRYGVPVAALLKVNGFNSASQIQPGTRLIIPVYNAASTGASAAKAAEAKVNSAPVTSAAAKSAATSKVAATVKAAPAKTAVIPGAVAAPGTAKLTPATAAKVEAKKLDAAKADVSKPSTTTAAKAVAPAAAPAIDPTPTASLPAPSEEKSASNNPEVRWPARGRIIQGFKAGSGGNDGINIAVPEGTSVKAAEGGVVAYAGSELKGYGNLVLIRHPNGFVSAYANNSEIAVKRGDQVKRGQIVAKSGQTGNVASPQLHFELRKGSVPVDPTNFLAGL